MFREMLEIISLEVVLNLLNVQIQKKEETSQSFTVNVSNSNPNEASNNTNKAPTTGDEANILAILSLAGASLVIFKALSRKKNINF